MPKSNTQQNRLRIKRKIRSRVFGTAVRPRLSVFRSNKSLYAQLINDENGTTIASARDTDKKKKTTKVESASSLGKTLASSAKSKGVGKVVFDRNGLRYAGRIKAFAEAARAEGLEF